MPRLEAALLHRAYRLSPLLPLLLRTTRDLRPAINELHWLREHVHTHYPHLSLSRRNQLLWQLCLRRARAEPLQYILRTQPFGELEIGCRRGVLIPRNETEAYTTHVANLILHSPLFSSLRKQSNIKILDLCSGSGCISLLLHSLLRPPTTYQPSSHDAISNTSADANHSLPPQTSLQIQGLDISPAAVKLSQHNLLRNLQSGTLNPAAHSEVRFHRADILGEDLLAALQDTDLIVCNPPYVSVREFWSGTTERSVRIWEPSLALVPSGEGREGMGRGGRSEDVFYERLGEVWRRGGLGVKGMAMEVGGEEQGRRVVRLLQRGRRRGIVEIWRDGMVGGDSGEGSLGWVDVEAMCVRIRGDGNWRAIVVLDIEALGNKTQSCESSI